jgi:hypothetical protein
MPFFGPPLGNPPPDEQTSQQTPHQSSIPAEPIMTARDKAAKEYYLSERFKRDARAAFKRGIIERGDKKARIYFPEVAPKKRDLPYIKKAAQELKKEFPELNSVRINSDNELILSTRKKLTPGRIFRSVSLS